MTAARTEPTVDSRITVKTKSQTPIHNQQHQIKPNLFIVRIFLSNPMNRTRCEGRGCHSPLPTTTTIRPLLWSLVSPSLCVHTFHFLALAPTSPIRGKKKHCSKTMIIPITGICFRRDGFCVHYFFGCASIGGRSIGGSC
jgi:hypothetical protein